MINMNFDVEPTNRKTRNRRVHRAPFVYIFALILVGLSIYGAIANVACSPRGGTADEKINPGENNDDDEEIASDNHSDEPQINNQEPIHTTPKQISLQVLYTGLNAPWDIVQTPDNRVFISERDTGRVLELLDNDERREIKFFDVDNRAEGGLLGLTLAPDYAQSGVIFAYYTTSQDNRVVKFLIDSPDDESVILEGIPRGNIHNGGRLKFGPDGFLYIGTGDAGRAQLSQDRNSLAGKILRITPDGEPAPENPFNDSMVYSMGHRNIQGLAWDNEGRLYATEFGPQVDDEINIIEAGGNYGWPEVSGVAEDDKFIDPVIVRQPPEASWSGLVIQIEGANSQWNNSLIAASLRGQRLWRFPIDTDGTVNDVQSESLFENEFGRLRQIIQANDGSLWFLTNNRDGRGRPEDNDDRVIRIGWE